MLRCLVPSVRCFTRPYSFQSNLPPTIKQILSGNENVQDGDGPTTVYGWIKSIRRQKNVSFVVVNDGTTLKGLQAVLLHPATAAQTAFPKRLNTGASVRLTGKLIESTGTGQEKELRVENVELLGTCDPETYPIQKKEHSLEFLRENVHLRARTDSIAAMLRVRDKLARGFGDWFEKEGFLYAHAPVLTSNDCEGAGEAFCVVSDSSNPSPASATSSALQISPAPTPPPVYLTTSTQLHLEALTSAVARVYTIAPSFRAERSQTNRHLCEFWMLEAEMSFLNLGIDGVCDVIEVSLKSVLGQLKEDDDIQFLRLGSVSQSTSDVWDAWLEPTTRWRRITYTEALDALQAHHASGAEPRFVFAPPAWGGGFRSEHERWISEWFGGDALQVSDGASMGGPVFVTDYPRGLKPFYMWVNDHSDRGENESGTVACFDLLVPRLGELTGGSVRESRMDKLRESLGFHGMDEAHHLWYINLRQYGTTPHGGFGIGFERLVSWFCGIENVRECVPFPRWAGRVIL